MLHYNVQHATYNMTFPRRFAGLAGLELRRHRRVFATTGSDDWGGGTHVFTFSKPEGA
jgi:hypothetical protein